MKRLAFCSILSAGLAICMAVPVLAQQPLRTASRPSTTRPVPSRAQAVPAQPAAASSGGIQVAVIDVAYVFKNYERFNQQLEAIKREIEAFENDLRKQQQAFGDLAEQLKQYTPESPEYKRIDAEATRKRINLQADAAMKKKQILEKEAKSYYDAYQIIQGAVKSLAERYNIGLVLRFDREEMTPSNRASVLKGVNRAVVYQRNLDITDLVLETINR
jgi:Skp family chaperone for outer membrane proteins